MKTKLKIYQDRLDMYLKAEQAILEGAQSYEIGTRKLTRADLHEIRMMIDNLMNKVAEEEAIAKGKSRMRTVGVIPRDW